MICWFTEFSSGFSQVSRAPRPYRHNTLPVVQDLGGFEPLYVHRGTLTVPCTAISVYLLLLLSGMLCFLCVFPGKHNCLSKLGII